MVGEITGDVAGSEPKGAGLMVCGNGLFVIGKLIGLSIGGITGVKPKTENGGVPSGESNTTFPKVVNAVEGASGATSWPKGNMMIGAATGKADFGPTRTARDETNT